MKNSDAVTSNKPPVEMKISVRVENRNFLTERRKIFIVLERGFMRHLECRIWRQDAPRRNRSKMDSPVGRMDGLKGDSEVEERAITVRGRQMIKIIEFFSFDQIFFLGSGFRIFFIYIFCSESYHTRVGFGMGFFRDRDFYFGLNRKIPKSRDRDLKIPKKS